MDLKTGEYVDTTAEELNAYDQRKARQDPLAKHCSGCQRRAGGSGPEQSLGLPVQEGRQGREAGPVEGKGLWSTMYGYVALESDTTTIAGITFYEHGETPGLGGEVDNPNWQALWPGRKAFDDAWNPKIDVKKVRPAPWLTIRTT